MSRPLRKGFLGRASARGRLHCAEQAIGAYRGCWPCWIPASVGGVWKFSEGVFKGGAQRVVFSQIFWSGRSRVVAKRVVFSMVMFHVGVSKGEWYEKWKVGVF